MQSSRYKRPFVFLASTLLITLPLVAQEAPAPADASPGSSATAGSAEKEQIIELSPFRVTAQKDNTYLATNASTGTRIALAIESTPMAMSVITKDFLADRGSLNMTDAADAVPNLRRNSSNAVNFTLRGFGTGSARVDGFPDAGQGARGIGEMAEIERLEVVKGPTSALFGFGNPGGVVNLVTKRPQAERSNSLMLELGSYARKKAVVDATGPVAKRGDLTLLYRVIGAKTNTDGFRTYEHQDSSYFSTQMQANYRNTTTLRVGMRYIKTYDHAEANENMPFQADTQTIIVPERDYSVAGPNTFALINQYTEFAEFTHTFSKHLAVRAAYSYDDQYYNCIRRIGSAVALTDLTHVTLFGKRFDDKRHADSLQYDVTGSWETPVGDFKAVVGGSRIARKNRLYGETNSKLPQRLFPIFDKAARDYSIGSLSDFIPTPANIENDIFSDQVYYALTTLETWRKRLTLLAAVGRGVSTTDVSSPTSSALTTWTRSMGEFKITKPQFGASLKLVDGLYVYANKGESGAINPRFPDSPEEGESYEAGLKVNYTKFSGDVTYFHTVRKSVQQAVFNPLTGGFNFLLSGEELAKGLELNAQYFPTKQFQIVGSYAYTDTAVVSDLAIPARVGAWLPNTPKHSARLWTKYTFKGGALNRVWVGLGMNYSGRMLANNNPAFYRGFVGGNARFDAALGYTQKLADKRSIVWLLNLENLTDKDYVSFQYFRGRPFSYRLTSTLHF